MNGKWKVVAILLACVVPQHRAAQAEGAGADGYRLSEPVSHGNLAIYLVHGPSRGGAVPLTLQEALKQRSVVVRETGQVNELSVENTGDSEVFIQGGDIVKGGQQDRVLSVSQLLPPHSGPIPIASFCVESGRWAARGGEDARTFANANAALPSRLAKLEMAATVAPKAGGSVGAVGTGQQNIWRKVAEIQSKLSTNIGAPMAAPRSRTSLQLTLENDQLAREQADYLAALEPAGLAGDDIVGFVFAVNGKVNSADIYPSNGLFRKMWPKLLRTSITEAIGERGGANEPPPPAAAASSFIAGADRATAVESKSGEQARVRVKEGTGFMAIESRPALAPPDAWVHRSYLAK